MAGRRPRATVEISLPAHRSYLQCLYGDLLGRRPQPTEMALALERLGEGTARRDLAAELLATRECRRRRLDAAFRELLRRPGRPDELDSWGALLGAGRRFEDALAALVLTKEFRERSGGREEHYVAACFEALTGRPASAGEISGWACLLASGALTPMSLVASLVRSDDYREAQIRRWYRHYVARLPRPDEIATLLKRHGASGSLEALHAELLGSEEYFYHAGFRPPLRDAVA